MANYSWDSVIENDGKEFVVLPEGDYAFTVDGFEKATVKSGKYQGAPMAALTLKVTGEEGASTVYENIILNDAFDWKIAGFFRAIGAKKKGEKMVMNWNAIEGAKGKAHFTVEKDSKGYDRNRVDRYIDCGEMTAEDEEVPF